jgi:CRP-like cAMP-binding protein
MAGPPGEDAAQAPSDLEYRRPPDSRYVRRMATFHDVDPVALWGFLTSGSYARCPPGRTLLAEGAPAAAYYMTINGAVEKVLVRGNRRIRVGLAGPGKAFGYESLIDGRPSPVTAITRERALLLVVPRDLFEQLFNGGDAVSRGFLGVIQRDLVATLRETLRPSARLRGERLVRASASSASAAMARPTA